MASEIRASGQEKQIGQSRRQIAKTMKANRERILKLVNINKIYHDGVQAVFDFNLEIGDKEFIVLVGPSGCGKSTTLRMIAGLEDISFGQFFLDGQLMNAVPSKNRGVAMVFQNYALYPHMSVYQNMAMGLKLRKVSPDEIARKIDEAASILGLQNYLNRKPRDLSGGQRQRVALGRAIVRSPRLFLMDEPLSNLDARLRADMREQIRKLHDRLGSTSIYVTHDQLEAMTMADRIVVMRDGFIQQVGTPSEIYHTPANVFVAKFIGSPEMNIFPASVSDSGDLEVEGQVVTMSEPVRKALQKIGKKSLLAGVRPSDIVTGESVNNEASFCKVSVEIAGYENLGDHFVFSGKLGTRTFRLRVSDVFSAHHYLEQKRIDVFFDRERLQFFDDQTERNLIAVPNEATKLAVGVQDFRADDRLRKEQILARLRKKGFLDSMIAKPLSWIGKRRLEMQKITYAAASKLLKRKGGKDA